MLGTKTFDSPGVTMSTTRPPFKTRPYLNSAKVSQASPAIHTIDDDDAIDLTRSPLGKIKLKAPSNACNDVLPCASKERVALLHDDSSRSQNTVCADLKMQEDPRSRRFSIFSDDCLSDVEFDQWMESHRLSWPQIVIGDDEAVDNEPASENTIRDNLVIPMIARPVVPSSISQQRLTHVRRREVKSVNHKGFEIRPGVTVELSSGSFLLVESVYKAFGGLCTIKGYRLVRQTHCGRWFSDQGLNELVWLTEIDQDEHRAGLEVVLQEEQVSEVKQTRDIIFTNRPWKDISFDHGLADKGLCRRTIDEKSVKEKGQLYCRWKYTQVRGKLQTDHEACLSVLSEDEAVGIGLLKSSEVRKNWYGRQPNAGGSWTRVSQCVETGATVKEQRYTLGDCFCGAGGVSRGAIMAGLQVAWGFDSDEDAIDAHAQNFAKHGTRSLAMTDAEFLSSVDGEGYDRVDIVHYSPPCQPFSPANHNKNNERDFINQKALFSIHHLTQTLKPRVATLEETAGLLNRHHEWFDALVSTFTGLGYSVRWKIVACSGYGIPQNRPRLVLFAAAPGEKLPHFPAPTHGGPGSGLLPFVKIRDVIYSIPVTAPNQNMAFACKSPHLLQPYSDDSLAKCITTSGGQHNHHPSGTRYYNVRECACLQGFPAYHGFSTRRVGVAMRQVGNALPPPLGKSMFEPIVASLKETDGITE
jgi:DNA (cytosine-5)-methyltransferase 1